ncbi:MAG: M20/M25/M40 family metallo-hydrolase [Armatimonadetes bacterium]|nr:M20/M25/M40 family metallo-hydrolase [Armatimonadota bacterium]
MNQSFRGCCQSLFPVLLLHTTASMGQSNPTIGEPHDYHTIARRITDMALRDGRSYAMLHQLCTTIGHRLSGSPQAAQAVEWGRRAMIESGLERVHLQPVLVPHWERGTPETVILTADGNAEQLRGLALGGSVATPPEGITAEVIEVHSIAEVAGLGERARGNIIFFNRPMDPTLMNTFDAYSGAVDQRVNGPVAAARVGAAGVLVRSITTAIDTFPHTGMLRYNDTVTKIPALAISTADAEHLSTTLRRHPNARVTIQTNCRTLPDAESHNVIGQLTGTEKPEEVVVIGGHLDSWDVGHGAHDDGAGCVQAIEALRLLKVLGLRPKRTIRAVLWMNEENGFRGGIAYADSVGKHGPRHIAAIESDRGGFAPRGFFVEADMLTVERVARWAEYFRAMGAERFVYGGGGADIAPLKAHGALNIGLNVESHRYFDYHHAASDTFGQVNRRELELGAAAMALLAWLIAEEGVPDN